MTRAATGLGVAMGAAGLGRFIGQSVRQFEEARKVSAQTAAALKSTGGAANVSARQISTLANSLSKKTAIDDEAIQSAQNLLLTFTRVRNEVGRGNRIFDRASATIVDVSVAFKKDLNASAILVGKALNDPIRGLTSLSRVGVQFTQSTRDQIKALVESGRVMDAQKLILRELEIQTKGSAAAQATALQRLRVSWEDLQEQVGAKLAPVLDKAATALSKFLDEMETGRGAGGDFKATMEAMAPAVEALARAIADGAREIRSLVEAFNDLKRLDLPALADNLGDIIGLTNPAAGRVLNQAVGAVRPTRTRPSVRAQGVEAGAGLAGGGWIPGPAFKDATPVLASGGEFFVTGPGQQQAVESGLAHPGLWDWLASNQAPHFQAGGRVRGSGPTPGGFAGDRFPDRGVISVEQAADLARYVGLRGRGAATAAAIVPGESGGRIAALGDGGKSGGLWQIYTGAHPEYSLSRLTSDPVYNARAMSAISSGGKNFRPWTVFKLGRHLPYMARAMRAVEADAARDPSGRMLGGLPGLGAPGSTVTGPPPLGAIADPLRRAGALMEVGRAAFEAGQRGEPLFASASGKPTDILSGLAEQARLRGTTRTVPGAPQGGAPAAGGPPGLGRGPNPRLVAFGKFLQKLGYRVAEHPAFGGVGSGHSRYGPPDHFHGGALDITGSNMGRIPGLVNQWVAKGWLSKWGPGTLWQVAGHYDHVHVSAHRRGGWPGRRFQRGGGMGVVPGLGYRSWADPGQTINRRPPGGAALIPGVPGSAFGALAAVLRAPQASIGAALQGLGMVLQDAARVSQAVLDRMAAYLRGRLRIIEKDGISAAERPRANILGATLGAVVGATQGRFGAAISRSREAVERMEFEQHLAENRILLSGMQQGTPAMAQAMVQLDQQRLAGLRAQQADLQAQLAKARVTEGTTPESLKDLQDAINNLTTAISDTEVEIYEGQQEAAQENTEATDENTAAVDEQTLAQQELAAAEKALAKETKALRLEVRERNRFAKKAERVGTDQAKRMLADVLSGEIVGHGIAPRAASAGYGIGVSW